MFKNLQLVKLISYNFSKSFGNEILNVDKSWTGGFYSSEKGCGLISFNSNLFKFFKLQFYKQSKPYIVENKIRRLYNCVKFITGKFFNFTVWIVKFVKLGKEEF